jgi:hypothetical protein
MGTAALANKKNTAAAFRKKHYHGSIKSYLYTDMQEPKFTLVFFQHKTRAAVTITNDNENIKPK